MLCTKAVLYLFHSHTESILQSHVVNKNTPWKHSRYSSFCMLPATCMMAMGKLWDEAANTAEASDTSFLSRNSAADESKHLSSNIISKFFVFSYHQHKICSYVHVLLTFFIKKPHPRAQTASSRSRRTCWCRWWCCSWSGGCSCRAPAFQSPVRWIMKTWLYLCIWCKKPLWWQNASNCFSYFRVNSAYTDINCVNACYFSI